MHGLDLLDALDRFFAPGFQRGPYGGQYALAHERAFAGTAHAGNDREPAKRHGDGDVLQIIFMQSAEDEGRRFVFLAGTAPGQGRGSGTRLAKRLAAGVLTGQLDAGQRFFVSQNLLERTGCDDLAALHARAGAKVDDVIGPRHRVLVVLDDDDRVAARTELLERAEQLLVVARVQADRRLVEHVQHAAQVRAKLRGQADALGLAAAQRGNGAAKLQIIEADFAQETQP